MSKLRYLLPIMIMLFAFTVTAQEASPEAEAPFDQGASFTQDPGGGNTEGCGTIDPNKPCYSAGGGTAEVCINATNYDTCMSKCRCEYRKNKKKCGTSTWCTNLALSEQNACFGNCLTDWA